MSTYTLEEIAKKRPWRVEFDEMLAFHGTTQAGAVLKNYVRVHPKPSNGGYTYAWVCYRKPLGYLMLALFRLRQLYFKALTKLAWWGFLSTDLDGGVLHLRDFTLNIFRVHRERLLADARKRMEAREAGVRLGYLQGWTACFDEALRVAIAGTSLLPPRRPNAWPWEQPKPNGVVADLKDRSLEGPP